MTARVYKYQLKLNSHSVRMPKGAHLLTLESQCGSPYVWALVSDVAPLVNRRLIAVPTGAKLGDYLLNLYPGATGPHFAHIAASRYIGTAHDILGYPHLLVYHFFDYGEETG